MEQWVYVALKKVTEVLKPGYYANKLGFQTPTTIFLKLNKKIH